MDVISFLENMGSQAHWGNVSEEDIALALAQTEIEESVRSAILAKDVEQLHILMQQQPPVGFLVPGEEEEEEEGDETPDEPERPKDAQHSSSPLSLSLR